MNTAPFVAAESPDDRYGTAACRCVSPNFLSMQATAAVRRANSIPKIMVVKEDRPWALGRQTHYFLLASDEGSGFTLAAGGTGWFWCTSSNPRATNRLTTSAWA